MSLSMASPIFIDHGKTQFRGRLENGADQVHRRMLRLEHLHLALVRNPVLIAVRTNPGQTVVTVTPRCARPGRSASR